VDLCGIEASNYERIRPLWQTNGPFVKKYCAMVDPLKPLFSGFGGSLERLARKAAATSALADQVRESLPENLRGHVVSAVRRGDDLVIGVDSAAWSARVRYAGAQLLERLEARGEAVKGKLRVKVGRKGIGDRG
jgi:hypothetical protein